MTTNSEVEHTLPGLPHSALIAKLTRFASLALGRHGVGEHIVSDVLARADSEADCHDWSGPISRDLWLYTLTVRACRQWLEGLAPSKVWEDAREAEHRWAEPSHAIDLDPLRRRVTSPCDVDLALAGIPNVDRIAVLLSDAVGLTLDECVKVTRAPVEITLLHLRRGRETLLEALSTASPPTTPVSSDETGHPGCTWSRRSGPAARRPT